MISCFSDVSSCEGLIFVCVFLGVLPAAKVSQYSKIITLIIASCELILLVNLIDASNVVGLLPQHFWGAARRRNENQRQWSNLLSAPVESMMRILHGCIISTMHPTEQKRNAYLCLKRGNDQKWHDIFFLVLFFSQCQVNLCEFCSTWKDCVSFSHLGLSLKLSSWCDHVQLDSPCVLPLRFLFFRLIISLAVAEHLCNQFWIESCIVSHSSSL